MNETITLNRPTPAGILGVAVTIAAGQKLLKGPESRRARRPHRDVLGRESQPWRADTETLAHLVEAG